jgi:predicted dehydrogenase
MDSSLTDPTRRTFLLAAAAGAAAKKGEAASGKIRTGILGVQHSHLIGKLEAMRRNPLYELVSVAEPDLATRRSRESHPALQGLKWVEPDALIADPSLDLVVFEGAVKDAIPMGRRVLEAGKHLHLEKPPSDRLEPFRELVELARRKQRLLQLGYIWRFHEGARTALEAMKQGALGEVFMIRATINSDRDQRQRLVEARYPGGTMFELGGHMIDLVIALLGRPGRVQSWLRHDTGEDDDLKDNTLAVFEYPKALALVVSSAKMAGSTEHRSFEVIGTDGTILIKPMEPVPTLEVHMRKPWGRFTRGWQKVQLAPQPRYIGDMNELADAIANQRPLEYSYDHELLLQETLLRASGEIS